MEGVLGAVLAFVIGASAAQAPAPAAAPSPPPPAFEPVLWRESRAIGEPFDGRLLRGVRLPPEGADHFTWDGVRLQSPNRPWRRWGTHTTIATVLTVLRDFRQANPGAPRVGVGDLSRPRGGDFGERFGGLGHASHQNGTDIDVFYPRLDHLESEARPREVDRALAQDLVERFVAAGAQYVFVGTRLGLRGPRRIVQPLRHHNDHLHVRLPPPPR